MIDDLYIHAGSHKTGTSSIQRFLRSNKEQLIGHDIHVADFRGMMEISDEPSFYDINVSGFDSLKKLDAGRLIVSHEGYSWVNDITVLEKFRDMLLGLAHRVHIIFYLRRQDMLAISHKQEGAKWTGRASQVYSHEVSALPEVLTEMAYCYLDFDTRINKWARVFGDENMIIRAFERECLVEGDVVHDFCSNFGINAAEFKQPARANESLSRTSQLFLHQTGEYFHNMVAGRKLITRAVKQMEEGLEIREKLFPSRKQAVEFYQQFVDGNKRLNQRFQISPQEAIFNDDFSFYPEDVDARGLSHQQLHQIYADIFSHLSAKRLPRSGAKNVDLAHCIRDIALDLPADCQGQAISLLRIANGLHPKGTYIRKKLEELEKCNMQSKDG